MERGSEVHKLAEKMTWSDAMEILAEKKVLAEVIKIVERLSIEHVVLEQSDFNRPLGERFYSILLSHKEEDCRRLYHRIISTIFKYFQKETEYRVLYVARITDVEALETMVANKLLPKHYPKLCAAACVFQQWYFLRFRDLRCWLLANNKNPNDYSAIPQSIRLLIQQGCFSSYLAACRLIKMQYSEVLNVENVEEFCIDCGVCFSFGCYVVEQSKELSPLFFDNKHDTLKLVNEHPKIACPDRYKAKRKMLKQALRDVLLLAFNH